MKLTAVKLSGFKSFVDQTKVSFNSNLTAIVGPNGCGKSNVIDAVRWVLGESSAKNLRSDSMSDVIFKGSSSRKPVARASVELFFDNLDGRIGGEFAGYNEISVRRTLDVDGQSNYYLNGSSCRKRDITDIFFGTGLGPRSYAIIEQDMISKLVSSRPEEIRSYIEEVAGISKYLDRRKETESRIKRTKENLSRLEDLREEIGRLLLRLKHQARSAEKYSEFRNQESHIQGLLWASNWKVVSHDTSKKNEKVRLHEIKIEEVKAAKSSLDTMIETKRVNLLDLQTTLDNIQEEFYRAGSDISRSEQTLDIEKQKLNEIREEHVAGKESLVLKEKQLKQLLIEKEEIQIQIEDIESKLEKLRDKHINEYESDISSNDIERDWIKFTKDMGDLIQEFKDLYQQLKKASREGLTKEKSSILEKKVNEIEFSLKEIALKPSMLINKTSRVLVQASEINKAEKKDFLDKTKLFADFQAKLTTVSFQKSQTESEIEKLHSIIQKLEQRISLVNNPIKETENSLNELLEGRLSIENKLSQTRKTIELTTESIRAFELNKVEKEQQVNSLREELEHLRLEHQASKIEAESIKKQIFESKQDLESLLYELSEEKTPEILSQELESLESKISRLGAINLAAQDELTQEENRKNHLDQQHDELMRALETLQQAIKKIDKETRTVFKDTFDQINNNLKKAFPKLFGGGHAELVMLGEDLLASGVGILARPPGKKNSSIAQLSGGEKALSAIALVFSFFELNPSPFCMLDEVDAPLDDLNTMRFIALVEEMSTKIQFVFITHNKISMERCKHLMGVTMQEPGVSRLVAVDVEEAVRIAAN